MDFFGLIPTIHWNIDLSKTSHAHPNLEWTIAGFASQAFKNSCKISPMANSRIEITNDIISKLRSEQQRTGAGIQKLFRGTNDIRPDGLTSSSIVHHWLSGDCKTAEKSHVDWVLTAYRKYGTSNALGQSVRITIDDKRHNILMRECERTRLGATAILKHAMKNLPHGLNSHKVQSWMNRATKSAKREHWDLVMRLYASIGDSNDHPQR